jgi:hypothetical protein
MDALGVVFDGVEEVEVPMASLETAVLVLGCKIVEGVVFLVVFVV